MEAWQHGRQLVPRRLNARPLRAQLVTAGADRCTVLLGDVIFMFCTLTGFNLSHLWQLVMPRDEGEPLHVQLGARECGQQAQLARQRRQSRSSWGAQPSPPLLATRLPSLSSASNILPFYAILHRKLSMSTPTSG